MRTWLALLFLSTAAVAKPLLVDQTKFRQAGQLGEHVWRLSFSSSEEANNARQMLEDNDADIWQTRPTSILLRDVTNLAGTGKLAQYHNKSIELPFADQKAATMSHDQADIARSLETLANFDTGRLTDPIHSVYHPEASINAILRLLANDFDGLAELVELGKSSEGRPVNALRVTNRRKQDGNKKGFMIVGGQHSREWISTSTVLYLAHQILLQAASDDPLLDYYSFTFVPVTNPDGYVYTWTTDRLWRKNRQRVSEDCFGVDMNRNWGYKWQGGTRPNPCSDAYPGAEAFSAPELVALKSYIEDPANDIVAFLDLHSFGQMLMFPFSYSCDATSKDEENHFEAVVGAAKALRDVHGKNFEVGSVCSVSLTSPGESVDWTYMEAGVKWSFAAELRDAGIFGFLLPPSQIVPSGQEMHAALTSLAQFVMERER